MDSGGLLGASKIDAYLKCVAKKKTYKTRTLVQYTEGSKYAPVDWNQTFYVPAQLPVIEQKIVLNLMDKENMQSDEVAGSVVFYVQELLESYDKVKGGPGVKDTDYYNGKFIWKNIYGSPLNQSNSKAKKLMNLNPELASTWKGRILFQVHVEKTAKPISQVVNITNKEALEGCIEAIRSKKFAFRA